MARVIDKEWPLRRFPSAIRSPYLPGFESGHPIGLIFTPLDPVSYSVEIFCGGNISGDQYL